MKIRQLGCLFIMIGCISLAMPALGADVPKIGIVDFQKVWNTSEAGKMAIADIDTKGKAMESELKKQGSELQDAKDRLDREALVMSQDKRSQKERDLRIKAMDFQDKQKRYGKEFNDFRMKIMSQMQEKVLALSKEIGKKKGYTLILEKNTSGALYFPASIDITDQLIKMCNEDYAKEQAKQKAKEKKAQDK
jgi:outer membrane protein